MQYARQMREGLWHFNAETIKFDVNGNLLDGQHRLMAIVKSGCAISCLVVRNLPSEVFSTIDRGTIRSYGDVFSIKKIPQPAFATATIIKYFALRKNLIIMHSSSSDSPHGMAMREYKLTAEEALDIYKESEEVFAWAINLGRRCASKLNVVRATEIAAYAAYFLLDKHYTRDIIEDFYFELLINEMPKNAMLAKYRADLISEKLSIKTKWTKELKRNNFVKVWNYYVSGKSPRRYNWLQSEGSVEILDNPNYGLEMLS